MKCDGCTLCCKLLLIPWMDSPAGECCKKCNPGQGCRLWPNAPQKCKEFACLYRQANSHPDLRPDKCKVIFEKVKDTFIFGTPAKDFKLTPVIHGQIKSFVREGYSVVINVKPRPFVWLAKGQNQNMLKELWKEGYREFMEVVS